MSELIVASVTSGDVGQFRLVVQPESPEHRSELAVATRDAARDNSSSSRSPTPQLLQQGVALVLHRQSLEAPSAAVKLVCSGRPVARCFCQVSAVESAAPAAAA